MSDGDQPALLDVPHAPDVFAAGATGFFILEGNIIITFESVRPDYSNGPNKLNRVVVGRLVMPIRAAQSLVAGLNDFLEKQGLSPSNAIIGGASKQ